MYVGFDVYMSGNIYCCLFFAKEISEISTIIFHMPNNTANAH